MNDLEKEIDEALGIRSPENKKFHRMQEIAIERLHPPIAPKEDIDLREYIGFVDRDIKEIDDIDWDAISHASEFRRFIYWIRTGKVFRGSNDMLDIELKKTQKTINTVRRMPPELLQELKEAIKNRKSFE